MRSPLAFQRTNPVGRGLIAVWAAKREPRKRERHLFTCDYHLRRVFVSHRMAVFTDIIAFLLDSYVQ